MNKIILAVFSILAVGIMGCPNDTTLDNFCNDNDGDGHYAFKSASCPDGTDYCDDNRYNWTQNGCTLCVDYDFDGYGQNCDLGADCNDSNSDISACENCVDADGDGYNAADEYNCPTGYDKCDDDPNNWTQNGCTKCTDADNDNHGQDCDRGPDCNDSDDTIWAGCIGSCDPIEFYDTALEASIRKAIGKPNGPIGPDDISKVDYLDLSAEGITYISGIHCFEKLTYLDLGLNRIVDLKPLSGLTDLCLLRLARNQIVDLQPLSGLTDLHSLGLEGNQIVDLQPLSSLTALDFLHLTDNQIVDLQPLSSLNILEVLDIDKNQIVDLKPISGLAALEDLYLDNNQIVDLTPLVDNSGLDSGDTVSVRENNLNCTNQANNISILQNRGVGIYAHPCE